MGKNRAKSWSIRDSEQLYNLSGWGGDLFSVDDSGDVVVHPRGADGSRLSLRKLADELRDRGIEPPLLIRLSDILAARVEEIHGAFDTAIAEYSYNGIYRGVYPIKVNQDRYVVERLVESGAQHHFGLEAGSKPELLAVMAMLRDPDALIVCNGYKDREFVETAALGAKLGRRVILVFENPSELQLVGDVLASTPSKLLLGIRARLSTHGAGHWQESGGDRSKFGFSSRELVDAVEVLAHHDLLDRLQLLHFHIGSQISSIQAIKDAVREASRLYVELVRLGCPLVYLDVGGGLGIDYDGTQTTSHSSINYSLQEYANDVVSGVMEVCDPAETPHPTLISESGRALVAHHAVLIVEVLGRRQQAARAIPAALDQSVDHSLRYLHEAYQSIGRDNLLESYHDLVSYRRDCLTLFKVGRLDLEAWAQADDLFWAGCRRIQELVADDTDTPEELSQLEATLADICFCNFSLFQSIPDAWAIDQLFPVLPLQRLNEMPDRRAILADVTCDSDGTLDRFIGDRGQKTVLEIHDEDDRPYYLGFFLVGAYQEILGDLHNLLGDTNTVNISLDGAGGYEIDDVIAGNSVTEVLDYVQYSREELVARVRRWSERAIRSGDMTREDSRHLVHLYESGLAGYTYPESD